MSAITGIFYFRNRPVEYGLINRLTKAMATRGPDLQAHWIKDSIALGHCMLRATPESINECQPLVSKSGDFVLVWDGRLDNQDELRRTLVSYNSILRDDTDPELVLAAYDVWGEECPKRLLGDFSFAVWDIHKNRLFCARDQVGARPFYYVLNKHFFAFASEDEPLLELPGISNHPNEDRIASILVPSFFKCCDPLQSWSENVRKIGSGQCITITPDGFTECRSYWHLESEDVARYSSFQECQEAFLEVFGEAVRCRLRTIGNPAAMLSGGLDSAGMAAMIKRLLSTGSGGNLHTYSAISDDVASCVESQCIQSLTENLETQASYVAVPSLTGMVNQADLETLALSKTHPVDNSILLVGLMCLAASRDEHRVLMHGVSGDVAMHVPTYYPAYFFNQGEWSQGWNECQKASPNNTYLHGKSQWEILIRSLWAAFAPLSAKSATRNIRRIKYKNGLVDSMIDLDFAKRIRLEERLQILQTKTSHSALQRLGENHVQTLFPNGIVVGLEGYERVAGRFGVELRDPWADKRVLEFFVRLPLHYKIQNGWTKYLVRSAFARDLNRSVRWRIGKEHVGWNFSQKLLNETKAFAPQFTKNKLGPLTEYIDQSVVLAHMDDFFKCKRDQYAESCFWIATLALWLHRLDNTN